MTKKIFCFLERKTLKRDKNFNSQLFLARLLVSSISFNSLIMFLFGDLAKSWPSY